MKNLVVFSFVCCLAVFSRAQEAGGIGFAAPAFNLKNINGEMVSLDRYKDKAGVIVIFTCNHCPFSVAYEKRIIDLHQRYAEKGFPVVAINPNDPELSPEDSFDQMVKRAKKMRYPFPYLFDETQMTARAYGATRTPHVFLLKKGNNDFVISYIGAIDNNSESAEAADKKYIEDAIDAISKGEKPAVQITKALGCTIKWKRS